MPSDPLNPSLDDLASMTHQPPAPNPVPPIVNRAVDVGKRFYQGGLTKLAADAGYVPQSVSDNQFSRLLRSQGMQDASGFLGAGGALGTLRLFKDGVPDAWGKQSFHVVDDSGRKVAEMDATLNHIGTNPTDVHVDWLASTKPGASYHSIGGRDIRTLPAAMLEHYPQMESISATRVGGARRGKASALQGSTFGDAWDKLAAVLEGPLIKRYLDEARAAQASGTPGYAKIAHLFDDEGHPIYGENEMPPESSPVQRLNEPPTGPVIQGMATPQHPPSGMPRVDRVFDDFDRRVSAQRAAYEEGIRTRGFNWSRDYHNLIEDYYNGRR